MKYYCYFLLLLNMASAQSDSCQLVNYYKRFGPHFQFRYQVSYSHRMPCKRLAKLPDYLPERPDQVIVSLYDMKGDSIIPIVTPVICFATAQLGLAFRVDTLYCENSIFIINKELLKKTYDLAFALTAINVDRLTFENIEEADLYPINFNYIKKIAEYQYKHQYHPRYRGIVKDFVYRLKHPPSYYKEAYTTMGFHIRYYVNEDMKKEIETNRRKSRLRNFYRNIFYH